MLNHSCSTHRARRRCCAPACGLPHARFSKFIRHVLAGLAPAIHATPHQTRLEPLRGPPNAGMRASKSSCSSNELGPQGGEKPPILPEIRQRPGVDGRHKAGDDESGNMCGSFSCRGGGRRQFSGLAAGALLCYQMRARKRRRRSVRGRSSVVERQLPKLYVEGSIPFARSKINDLHSFLVAGSLSAAGLRLFRPKSAPSRVEPRRRSSLTLRAKRESRSRGRNGKHRAADPRTSCDLRRRGPLESLLRSQ